MELIKSVFFTSVDKGILAGIWSYFPGVESVDSLWQSINFTYEGLGIDRGSTTNLIFHFDTYIRFSILMCIVFAFCPFAKEVDLIAI